MYCISSAWTELLGQFFHLFTQPGSVIFANLMTGWVLCTTRRTITGILSFADPCYSRAHDAYHRFPPDARWATKRLWKQLPQILVASLCSERIVTLALDDTLFHHRGKKIEGAGKLDGCSKHRPDMIINSIS